MTKILKPMPLGSAGGERQNRVKSVECLDGVKPNSGRLYQVGRGSARNVAGEEYGNSRGY